MPGGRDQFAAEGYCRARLAPCLKLTPDLQAVLDPVNGSDPMAVVLEVRLFASFGLHALPLRGCSGRAWGPAGYRFVDDAVATGAARLLGAICASRADVRPDVAATVFRVCVRRAVAPPRLPGGTDGAIVYSDTLGPARLRTVIEHVERTLSGPVRLAELARLVHLSETHFCHSFGAATGATPLGYVRTRRVARARALLLGRPAFAITEIAYRSGFASQSHLTRAMRVEPGVTPAALRRRAAASGAELRTDRTDPRRYDRSTASTVDDAAGDDRRAKHGR